MKFGRIWLKICSLARHPDTPRHIPHPPNPIYIRRIRSLSRFFLKFFSWNFFFLYQ